MTSRNNSKYKIWRRLGINPWNSSQWPKNVKKKTPGQHGVSFNQIQMRQQKEQNVDYKTRLNEIRKVKSFYSNINQVQFLKYLKNSLKETHLNLSEMNPLAQQLNSRLDTWIHYAGFAKNPREARQLINHRRVKVNNKLCTFPSYVVSEGDLIHVNKLITSELLDQLNFNLGNTGELDMHSLSLIVLKPQGSFDICSWNSFYLISEHYR